MSYIKVAKIVKETVDIPEKGYIYFGYDSGGLWIRDDDGTSPYYILSGYASSPSISSFYPTSAFVGDTITINGNNFIKDTTSVTFNGVSGTSVTVLSVTQLTVVVPNTSTGAVNVIVKTPNGSSSPASFTVNITTNTPTISPPIVPAYAKVGSSVSINGYNFVVGATSVYFGGTLATATISNSTSITATVPNIPTGETFIFLETTSYGQSNSVNFIVVSDTNPTILDFSPKSGTTGTTITISGTNFATGQTEVWFGSTAASGITIFSSTSLRAVIDYTTPVGSTKVTVSNTSLSGLTVTGSNAGSVPTITDITPYAQQAGVTVSLIGTNLNGSLTVTFSGVEALVYPESGSTSRIVYINVNTSPGPNTVIATNQYGSSLPYIYDVSGPAGGPIITSFDPTSGERGDAIDIIGSNFILGAGNAIYFGGRFASNINASSTTKITATIPELAPTSDDVDVKVVNINGEYTKSGFVINAVSNPPIITNVSPSFGTAGQTVDIFGTNLGGVASFGTTYPGTSNSTNTIDSTHIWTTIPSGLVSPGQNIIMDVYDTTMSGSSSYSPFEVYSLPVLAPTITSFTPTVGTTGTVITINGTNFCKYWTGALMSVTVGSKYAFIQLDSTTFISTTQITAIIPNTLGYTGSSVIKVVNQAGENQKAGFTISGGLGH
jgi:hypothetical protein